MFTGSIAVPRPGGEGCGLVVGSLSAVLGCGLVSLHPLGCWCVGFNLLPGLFLGTALGLSQKTFGFPSPVGVLVSWLQPSTRFVFGDRLRSPAEEGLL